MTSLTEEQRLRIAENKRRAQERFAERNQRINLNLSNVTISPIPKRPNLNQYVGCIPQNLPKNVLPSTSNFKIFDPLKDYKAKVKVKLELISPTHVEIVMEPYMDDVKNLILAFSSAKYVPTTKRWHIACYDYYKLVGQLKTLKSVQCNVNEVPKWIKQMFIDCGGTKRVAASEEEINQKLGKSNIEHTLLDKLFPYQRAGVAFGIERQGRLLIADEMGLGKSLQALAIARMYSCEWPLLIVCPSSVKYAWKQQIRQFLPDVDSVSIIEKGSDKLPRERTSSTVMIMSYDLMVIKERELMAANIYVIIFDESHLLKDYKASRTKVATALAKNAQRKILLSGTPAMSRPAELFTQVQMVDSKIFTTFRAYAERYCEPKMGKFGWEAKGAANLQELSTIIESKVMIRRLKKDVMDQLPAKTREILYLSGDKLQTRLKDLQKSRLDYDKAEKSANAEREKSHLMTYFLETGMAKADSIVDYILEKYFYSGAPPVKLLLFAHHNAVMDIFSTRFSVAKISTIRIDGSTTGMERSKAVDSFQENPKISVAILSITAAGTGITLTAANKIIFAELYWTPGTLFQAEDRAHRVGQKNAVFIQYILARKTVDDIIWPKIQEKIMVMENLNLNDQKLDKLDKRDYVSDGNTRIQQFFSVMKY